jgi:hypothetical protein
LYAAIIKPLPSDGTVVDPELLRQLPSATFSH